MLVDRPDRHRLEVPDLPAARLWDPATVDWWRSAWQSPMRAEWDDSDAVQLLILVYLLDELLAELGRGQVTEGGMDAKRAQQLHKQFLDGCRPLGLSPMARRSLQWQIARVAEGVANAELAAQRARKAAAAPQPRGRARKRYKALEQ